MEQALSPAPEGAYDVASSYGDFRHTGVLPLGGSSSEKKAKMLHKSPGSELSFRESISPSFVSNILLILNL